MPESIASSSRRASAGESTGVAPFVTMCFGPRTAAAGFAGRIAARYCLTVGADPGWVRM